MDTIERATALRNYLTSNGFVRDYRYPNILELIRQKGGPDVLGRKFSFDLNMGQIDINNAEPWRVMRLVTIARHFADDAMYGEHNALLGLVAQRRELEKGGNVYWHRAYHVGANNNPAWVSLQDWLIENGQNPDSVRL